MTIDRGQIKVTNFPDTVSVTTYLYDVAKGLFPGVSGWNKSGFNPDVDAGTEDLWWAGGTYAWPTAEAQLEVYSSSERDQQQNITAFATSDGGAKTKVSVTATHGLTNGDKVIISGCATAAYNATHVIEQVSGDFFVIPVAYAATAAAGIVRGPGVNVVTIHYLNLAGEEKSVDVILGPKTAVATGTGAADIYRVQNFRAKTCGDSLKAIGTISVRNLADTPIYSQIGIGHTRARNSAWRVPLGKTLYITDVFASATGSATGKDAVFTFRSTYDDKAAAIRNFMIPYAELGIQDGGVERHFPCPVTLPALTDLLVSATVSNDNTFCVASMRGWLE